MSGAEVEDLAAAAVVAAAAAEYFTSREPAHKDQSIGLWDVEELAVHFFVRDINVLPHARRNGVAGVDDPEALVFADFAPL